jgi:hypothetical protein
MVLPDVTVEFNFHGAGSYSTRARKQELSLTRGKLFAAKAGGG